MIILDTNVLSETMKPRPDTNVMRWLRFASRDELYITAITEAEMRYGARVSPKSKRLDLEETITKIFEIRFAGHILPFDSAAAKVLPEILVNMKRHGRSNDHTDAQTAAIALCLGARIATRDVSGFGHCGVDIINPWTA